MKRRILMFEWITSVGGVQIVLQNIMPKISESFDIYFLDPYKHEFDRKLCEISNIKDVDLPIQAENQIGWNVKRKRPFLLLKFGMVYSLYLLKVCRYIRNNQINIVYVNSKKAVFFAYVIRKISGVPYIYHCHGLNSHREIQGIFKRAVAHADKVIAVSEDVKEKIFNAGIPINSIEVVHNGVNYEEIQIKKLESSPIPASDRFRILFAASLNKNKGLSILVDAFIKLLHHGCDCELVIAGKVPDGRDDEYIKEIKTQLVHVDPTRVYFTGFLDNIFPAIKSSDVLVLPSLSEGFGMVLAEAMCLEKPVIGSNVGGIPEVIVDGYNGFLFNPGESNELYSKLLELAESRELHALMGRNGLQLVENHFRSDIQAKHIIKIINGLGTNTIS